MNGWMVKTFTMKAIGWGTFCHGAMLLEKRGKTEDASKASRLLRFVKIFPRKSSGLCHGTMLNVLEATWMSQEVSKGLGSAGYNPNIPHL